ncbi:MAG: M67 family metallopeptidase [Sphingomonadales bacterium]|jgi:proteasome lid subunit RPN8/RPN11
MNLEPRVSSTAPIVILNKAHQQIIADASLGAYPQEACGLLLGDIVEHRRVVRDIVITRNIAPSGHDRFEVAPEDLLRVHKDARACGLHVLGHFHSHPNGHMEPSTHDAEQAHDIGKLWLIQAIKDDELLELKAYLAVRDEHWGWPFIALAIQTGDD